MVVMNMLLQRNNLRIAKRLMKKQLEEKKKKKEETEDSPISFNS